MDEDSKATKSERRERQKRIAARSIALAEAREQGREHFLDKPDQMLVAVCRYAATAFSDGPLELAFLQGYIEARQQRDDYRRERERDGEA